MSILFEPLTIGNFQIKNRFVRSATYFALSDENGFPGKRSTVLMKTPAENDIGLIITAMPLGLVGGMRSLPVMEEIVSSGIVDTISISRPLIREPDLIKK